ncbi:helix-turn-helix domain-containing protein [Legionella bozemanae]|uniref:helix-turn-helix domain-containing protein n=1 Tax=Legionella bozemanae TaxID=447 RepID=UPI00104179CC|nr:helix-turn-helix transcriptional regulator [Legionella bozemanae]
MADSPLPKRLKEARIAAGISQKQLGIAAGMDEFSASPRINQYETGKHTPDFLTLKRIADVLKLSPSYFYSNEDDLAEMIKIFSQLSPIDKNYILTILKGFK